MPADLLQFAPLQACDFELFEKNSTGIGLQECQGSSRKQCALAATALAHDDKALRWLDLERDAVEDFLVFELHLHIAQLDDMSWSSRSWEKDHINDVVERIDTDHGRDGGDDARGSGGTDAGRAAFNIQPAITGDRGDQQSEHKAFKNAGDDVADKERVAHQINKVNEGDTEVGACR